MSANEIAELQFSPVGSEKVDARPWPRYFARMIDVMVLSTITIFVLAIFGTILVPESTDQVLALLEDGIIGMLLSNIVGIALALLPIMLLLAFGQTPGKWLFGIRVRDHDGKRIGWRKALHREILVWVKGMGLGIPVVTMLTMFASHSTLTDDGRTSWDKRLQCHVTHAPATVFWWIKAIIGGAIVLAATFYGTISMALGV